MYYKYLIYIPEGTIVSYNSGVRIHYEFHEIGSKLNLTAENFLDWIFLNEPNRGPKERFFNRNNLPLPESGKLQKDNFEVIDSENYIQSIDG